MNLDEKIEAKRVENRELRAQVLVQSNQIEQLMAQINSTTFSIVHQLGEEKMPTHFEPLDVIQNILYVIKELNELLHECDSHFQDLYISMIKQQAINLDKAITDMKVSIEQ